MSYRDDGDAAQARIEALQTELAQAQRRVSELEGARTLALVPTGGNALAVQQGESLPWYGAPMRLELTRTFQGALPTALFEDLVDTIRTVTRETGRTEVMKSSLSWTMDSTPKGTGPFFVVTVSVREGRTVLTVSDRLGPLAGALYGGIGGGVGAGGMSLPIGIAVGALHAPVLAPVFALVWLGSVFAGARALFKSRGKHRAARLQTLFDALAGDIAARIEAEPASPRAEAPA